MMRKTYQKPKIAMEIFKPEDVITSSAMGNGGEDDWNKDNGQDRDDFFQPVSDDNMF